MAEETAPLPKALDAFTLFPKLPTELQLKIWKHAGPNPRIMQVHCIYPASTKWPCISLQQRCDAEATTPGDEVGFGTDTIPSGLLRACKQSRDVILKIPNRCIESGGRKIRFDKENDIIFLHTISQCCNRSVPGLPSRPDALPDYRKIFTDVQQLAMCGSGINNYLDDKLHSSTRHGPSLHPLAALISEFKSLKMFYVVLNARTFLQHEAITGDVLFQTFEELYALNSSTFGNFVELQERIERNSTSIIRALTQYKDRNNLGDWNIPTIKFVRAGKILSLGRDR